MGLPEISVVMAVYNCEQYVKEAIESIVEQTFSNFEFIIINDGSSDKSTSIIKSYKDERIILIEQDNKGLSTSLNIAINASRGKYIVRMDADDISLKNRIKTQWDFLETHTECVAVGSNAINIDKDGNHLYVSDRPTEWQEIRSILPRSPFYHSSTMLRKEIVIKSGGYLEQIKQHFEDRILWNKMIEFGELRNIKTPLIMYRIVPSAISNRSDRTNFIMDEISNSVLRDGRISLENNEILRKLTKRRSKRWMMFNYHLRIGKIFIERNFRRREASKNLCIALFYNPFSFNAWFNMMLLSMPKALIKKWKGRRGVL